MSKDPDIEDFSYLMQMELRIRLFEITLSTTYESFIKWYSGEFNIVHRVVSSTFVAMIGMMYLCVCTFIVLVSIIPRIIDAILHRSKLLSTSFMFGVIIGHRDK